MDRGLTGYLPPACGGVAVLGQQSPRRLAPSRHCQLPGVFVGLVTALGLFLYIRWISQGGTSASAWLGVAAEAAQPLFAWILYLPK
jgi:hypothetical protein